MTTKVTAEEPSAAYNGVRYTMRLCRLGDIARTSSGGTPRRDRPDFYGGSIPWVKSGELRDGTVRATEETITETALASSSAKIFAKGTICVALYGATVGRVGVLGMDAATNQAVCGIFPTEELRGDYLRYFLVERRQFLVDSGKGGAQPNISQQIVRDLWVPLPPIARQREIVAYLDEKLSRLDASVAALHRVQANLKRYTKSLIQSLTSGNEASTWREVSVDDIAQSLDNMRQPVNKTERALRGGSVPYLGANGQTGWIDKPLFNEELVLVVEDETFVGRTQPFCYYFAGECWVNNHTHLLRAKLGVVTAKYLNLALSYYPFIPLTTGSTGRRKLTKKALMAAPVPIPPLAEQHRIVAEADRRLSLIRVAEAQVTANLARAQRLRQSILQAAFRTPAQARQ